MDQLAYLVGWAVIAVGGGIAAGVLMLCACKLLRFAWRESWATVDMGQAFREWREKYPDLAKKYDDTEDGA